MEFVQVAVIRLLVAVLWCLQGVMCLLPGHAHGGEESAHHAHQDGSAATAAHHSHSPEPKREDECARHCASVAGALAASPHPLPAPEIAPIALPEFVALVPEALEQRGLRSDPVAHPPPDLLVLQRSLRI